MKTDNIRVLVVSKYSATRSGLKNLVESESNVRVVGEADNPAQAVNLVRDLQPDIAIVDTCAPRPDSGFGVFPGIEGVHTAQIIFGVRSNTRVVLLNLLENQIYPINCPTTVSIYDVYKEAENKYVPFAVNQLHDQLALPGSLNIMGVESCGNVSKRDTFSHLCSKTVLFGAVGIFLGILLAISLWLLPVAVFIIAISAIMLLLGSTGKLLLRVTRGI